MSAWAAPTPTTFNTPASRVYTAHEYELSVITGEPISARILKVHCFKSGGLDGKAYDLEEVVDRVYRYRDEPEADFVERVYYARRCVDVGLYAPRRAASFDTPPTQAR